MTHLAPSRLKLVLAFAAVYVIWGSTYLAIHFAIETMPSYFMTSLRFLLGGLMLYAWARFRGEPLPERRHWKPAAIIGALMLFGGMGSVALAQHLVPSGLTALIIAMVPVWLVLIESFRPNGVKPGPRVWLGIVTSFVGLMLLLGPSELTGGQGVHVLGAGLIVLATLAWSIGSIYSRSVDAPASPMMFTAMQMLAGSAPLLLAGLIRGEAGMVNLDAISLKSILAWLYLIVFGSVIAFTAYIWLLKVSDPARVGTYAYVNPVIAVLLGWAFNGEALSAQTLIGAALIIAAVVIIISRQQRSKRRSNPEPNVEPVQCADT